MLNKSHKIGLGGGCHWCTEGVFQTIKGVDRVEQGWISSDSPHQSFSEGVVVYFNPTIISLKNIIKIHLLTHACTSNHSFRLKYRSAVYYFDEIQKTEVIYQIKLLQADFKKTIITLTLPFENFKLNKAEQLNYFLTRPNQPFCKNFIHPKLVMLQKKHSKYLNHQKIAALNVL